MKIFFSSRQAMRSIKSGKAHDHGTLAIKRWSRDLSEQVKRTTDKRVSFVGNVKVITK